MKFSPKFKKAAIRNLNWASKYQLKNGWFENNELPLSNTQVPFTHTIAYAIEGFLWSGLILKDSKFLIIALKGSVPLLNYYLKNNFLPATLNEEWKSNDRYSCLTGDAQISLMWLELFKLTNEERFFTAASKMNSYLKRTQLINHQIRNIRGAIAGSYPIFGDLIRNKGYCRLAYLNWSTKFFIDALLSEDAIKSNQI